MNDIITTQHLEIERQIVTKILSETGSIGLQVMLSEKLWQLFQDRAQALSQAKGFVPQHLAGQTQACFAVLLTAANWRMDPYMVAGGTYATPGGKIGFEGKLIHAVLEQTGKLDGGIEYKPYGDWDKVQGKFKLIDNRSGKGKFPAPDWPQDAEKGLGIEIVAKLKGEKKARSFKMELRQAFPRNSTLWATDPRTQLGYLAIRRFASSQVPHLFFGVPGVVVEDGQEPMVDITPYAPENAPGGDKPREEDYQREAADPVDVVDENEAGGDGLPAEGDGGPEDPYCVIDENGEEVFETESAGEWTDRYCDLLKKASTVEIAKTLMEVNADYVHYIRENDLVIDFDQIIIDAQQAAYDRLQTPAADPEPEASNEEPPPPTEEDYNQDPGPSAADMHGEGGDATDWTVNRPNVRAAVKLKPWSEILKKRRDEAAASDSLEEFYDQNIGEMQAAKAKFGVMQLPILSELLDQYNSMDPK